MKLRKQETSTRPQIFDGGYEHPWYTYLKKPNPPTQKEIKKAEFVDKTYTWQKKK